MYLEIEMYPIHFKSVFYLDHAVDTGVGCSCVDTCFRVASGQSLHHPEFRPRVPRATARSSPDPPLPKATTITRYDRHVIVCLHSLIVQMFCRIYCRILCRILFPPIARRHTFSKYKHETHNIPPPVKISSCTCKIRCV